MRVFKLKVPIYRARITFIESSNFDEVVKYFKKIEFEFEGEVFAHTINHYRIEKGKKYFCVYIVFNRGNGYAKLKHSTIAHEAKHTADMIFDRIGADYYSDEPHAYLVEYIVNESNKFLNIQDVING